MCSSSRKYEDILLSRRDEYSNFMWVSRQIHPKLSYKQNAKPTPQLHKDEVLNSRKIQELIDLTSRTQNINKDELKTNIIHILDEIGYDKKLKVLRWLAFVLIKICNKVCNGIYLNTDNVVKLRAIMGHCPVIFVPSHRSYADFILMSYLCFNQELAIPAIAAGMDFQGMWGMGTMLRDSGAFFMRRSYNDDQLYWTTFKQYVYQIVTKGDIPIEFYIEGTRSRSNKSLPPKYGFILMVLKALFLSQVPDIIFVPINLSYERILEEKLFAFELLGIPKPKETTSGFFKSLSIVKEKYGSIYADFAEPISAKEFFGADLNRNGHNIGPIHQQEVTEEEKRLIPALTHEILRKQQKHCVIFTFNLIAVVIYEHYASEGAPIRFDVLVDEVEAMKKNVELLGGFVASKNGVEGDVLDALEVHGNILFVKDDSTVALAWDNIVLDKLNPNKLKGHGLLEKTISYSVPFVMLQIYINPLLHYVIDSAILVIVLSTIPEPIDKDKLYDCYHFLRTLLGQEFVYFKEKEQLEFESGLKKAISLGLVGTKDGGFYLGENKKLQETFKSLLTCFLFNYFVVNSVLSQSSSNILDEKSILEKCQALIEELINKRKVFIHPYALNLDSMVNCLNSMTEGRILGKSRTNGKVYYEINQNKADVVRTELGKYVSYCGLEAVKSIQLCLKTKL